MAERRLAVVTGASSGIGAETARMLIESGTDVIGVDLAWPETPPRHGLECITGSVHLQSTWQDVDAALARYDQPLRHLVINAAKLVVGPILDVSEENIRSTFEVNLFGAVLALKTCLPSMLEAGEGSVVGVASIDAQLAEQDLAVYASSKGALIQLMRSVAIDYAHRGIRANTVCPGVVDTPFFRQHVEAAPDPAAFLKTKVDRYPSGRILKPEDIASVIVFLLSDGAVGVNGAQLLVDGGLTATFDYHPKNS